MTHVADLEATRRLDPEGRETVVLHVQVGALRLAFELNVQQQMEVIRALTGGQRYSVLPLVDGYPSMQLPKGMQELTAETLNIRKVE